MDMYLLGLHRKDRPMRLGTVLFFVALGAILRFAVTANVSGIDIQALGLILMGVGVLGLLLWSYRAMLSASRRRREQIGPALAELVEQGPYAAERPDQTRPDSTLVTEEIEGAHLLVQQARPFLEAEGYTSQRIDELAWAFVAKNVGRNTEEFIDWALAQGRLGRDPIVDA